MKKMHSRYEIQQIAKTVIPTENKIKELAINAVKEDFENDDVKVKTIEQSEANQEFADFTYTEKLTADDGGYIGIKIINNVLYVIVTKKFSVNEAFTTGSLVKIKLPNDILAKLETLPNAFNSGTITSEVGSFQRTGQGVNPLLYKIMKMEDGIEINSSTNMQLVEGNSVEISVRTFFVLI